MKKETLDNINNTLNKMVNATGPVFSSVISIVAAVSMAILFSKTQFTQVYEVRSKNADELFTYMEKGIKLGRLNNEYYKTAFKYYDRKSDGALSKYGYIEIVEDFIVYINKNNAYDNQVEFHTAATTLLKEAKEIEPFSSLPEEERRLLDSMKIFVFKSDVTNTLNMIRELKQVMLLRYKEYEKIEKQNTYSIPLAFAGLGFTFLFGVVSIVIQYSRRRKQSSVPASGT